MSNSIRHPLRPALCKDPLEPGAIGGPRVKRIPLIVVESADTDGVPIREFYTDDGLYMGHFKADDQGLAAFCRRRQELSAGDDRSE